MASCKPYPSGDACHDRLLAARRRSKISRAFLLTVINIELSSVYVFKMLRSTINLGHEEEEARLK